jgi:hypothetical protein
MCRKARSQIMLIYRRSELTLKKPEHSTKNLLGLLRNVVKVAGYKRNIRQEKLRKPYKRQRTMTFTVGQNNYC